MSMANLQNGESGFQGAAMQFGDLIKALEASGMGGADGQPMIPQDLELEAYTVLWEQEHLKLLRHLPTIPAYSMAHEFTRITKYTSPDTQGFFREGGTPNRFEFRSVRKIENVRPIGEGYSVSGPMGRVRVLKGLGQQNIIAIQQATSILALEQKITRALYFANTLDFPLGSTTHFRGIEQIQEEDAPDSIIDLKGETITEDAASQAARQVSDNFGKLTHIFLSNQALADLARTVQAIRQVQGISEDYMRGTAGIALNGIRHMFGVSQLVADVFLNSAYSRYKNPPVYSATDNPKPANAPVTLADGAIVITVAAESGSKFDATEVGAFGTYYYTVTPDSSHDTTKDATGEGDPTTKGGLATPTGFTVVAGEGVTLTITSASDANSYKIYRAVATPTSLSSYQLIGEIRNTGGALVFKDLNTIISHTKDTAGNVQATSVAFGFNLPTAEMAGNKSKLKLQYENTVPDALKRVDLAPVHWRDQAIVGDLIANRLLLWYGAMEVTHPLRNVVYRNVGNRNL